MEFINKLNLKPLTILKFLGIVFVGLLVLSFLFQILGSTFRSVGVFSGRSFKDTNEAMYQAAPYGKNYNAGGGPMMSSRNVASDVAIENEISTGDKAESFEIKEHYATIETRHLQETCSAVSQLKEKDYVIFENANENDTSCQYSFKVKLEKVDEVMSIIKELNPKDLSGNTYTIKNQIDDYTSETEILIKKKQTIESTLENAISSYDEISRVATLARDAESLAKIIDSKIKIIERLSEERINISEQIDRINRAKAVQLDRLAYTYFNVSIYENKFVNGEELKDSWKDEIKRAVRETNEIAQNITINMLTSGFNILQYLIYAFALLFAAKYFWKFAVYFWKK